jgi:hypothetical protein
MEIFPHEKEKKGGVGVEPTSFQPVGEGSFLVTRIDSETVGGPPPNPTTHTSSGRFDPFGGVCHRNRPSQR